MNHIPPSTRLEHLFTVNEGGLTLFTFPTEKATLPPPTWDSDGAYQSFALTTLEISPEVRKRAVLWAVERLRHQQREVEAQALAARTALQAQINNLLSIEGSSE